MPRPLTICLLCLCFLLPRLPLAAELTGHYLATLDGQPAEMILYRQGRQVEGQYVENNNLRLNISGSFDGQLLRARISKPQSGHLLAMLNASYADGTLNARITARDPRSDALLERQVLFQRQLEPATTAAQQVPSNRRDPALVGTWVYQHTVARGGATPTSLTTILTLQLAADGSVTQWRRTLGGAPHGRGDSPGEPQYRGRWHSADGLLLVHLQGAGDFQPAAHYRFSEPYLVTESNTGKMFWQRR